LRIKQSRLAPAIASEAVKALIVANQFLETDLEKLKAAVSMGYARGRVPHGRKDWYD
jgi:hypothetical protein